MNNPYNNLTPQQQEAVKTIDGNILVSAGAGSGKTKVLSVRAYHLIKEVKAPISSLLILTFTNKAAAEMKSRIRALVASDPEIAHKVGEIDSAKIMTFDAYNYSLLKRYHNELNLSDNVSIIDGSFEKALTNQYLNETFTKLYEAKDSRLLKLVRYCALKNDSDIRKFAKQVLKELNVVSNIKEYKDNLKSNFYNEEYFELIINEFLTHTKTKVLSICKKHKYTDPAAKISIDSLINPLEKSNDYDEIIKALTGFKPIDARKIKDEIDKEIYKVTKKELEILEDISSLTKKESHDAYFTSYDFASLYLDIAYEVDSRLNKFQEDNECFTFKNIALKTAELLKNKDICNEIKNEIRYIMVDEYQDTSNNQEEILNALNRNNVFMVGDIKQSIYKFREANPSLFSDKFKNYPKGNNNEHLVVFVDNFRSSPKLLESFNDIFSKLMSEEIGDADYAKDHMINETNPVFSGCDISKDGLKILNYSKKDDYPEDGKHEAEARIVVKKILEIVKEDADKIINKINNDDSIINKKEAIDKALNDANLYSKHVILMRSRTPYDAYKKIFEEYNVPLYLDKKENAIESQLIIFYQNFLRLLDAKKDSDIYSFAFMSVGRNFVSKIDDNIIHKAVKNKDYDNVDFVKFADEIKDKLKSLSLCELVERLNDKFDIFNKLNLLPNVESNLEKLSSILSLAKTMDLLQFDIKSFIDYLTILQSEEETLELDEGSVNENAVNIMTIHSSKGLEFDNVYFTNLANKFKTSDLTAKFAFSYKLGFAFPDENDNKSVVNTFLYNKLINPVISEELRLFYVAITRAKNRCYLLKDTDSKKQVSNMSDALSYADFLSFIDAHLVKYEDKYSTNVPTFRIDTPIYQFKPMIKEINVTKEIIVPKRFSKEEGDLIDSSILEFGNRLHYILEIIDFVNKDTSFIIDKNDKEIIDKFINLDIFNFSNKDKIYHEYQFYDEIKGSAGIIDLLVIKDNEILIIDYKTSNINDNSYIEQLNGYRSYIARVFNTKNVKTYLCSILKCEYKEV